MICNEERHTERLTPKITTYNFFMCVIVTLRQSLLGIESVQIIKKWTLSYYIRKNIKLGEKQDTTYHLRDN